MPIHFLVPEVIQTSAMDCGPASLRSLLKGFGISVSYDRLREACQTDLDGTSLDALEQVANQIGLVAEQIMLPLDHILLTQGRAFPAIAVAKLPNENIHFMVMWQHYGAFVQVMDPAVGRRWIQSDVFLNDLYIHTFPVSAMNWREWAETTEFIKPLEYRMVKLGIRGEVRANLIASAKSDADWFSLAALDAIVRLVTHIHHSKGLMGRKQSNGILQELYAHAVVEKDASMIPAEYWFVQPAPPDDAGDAQLFLRGALLLRARGKRMDVAESDELGDIDHVLDADTLSALTASPNNSLREMFEPLFKNRITTLLGIGIVVLFSAIFVVAEALIFWLLINLKITVGQINIPIMSFWLPILALGLTSLTLLLNFHITNALLKFGQSVEVQLRRIFMYRIPLLGDRYFRSRLRSDMAARSHSMYQVRYFPETVGRIVFTVGELVFTTIAMIWLSPENILPIALAAIVAMGIPFLSFPILQEQDMRVRTHLGTLSLSYLDAMLGLIPLRAHNAEQALRGEHERILVSWRRAAIRFLNLKILFLGIQVFFLLGCLAWLIIRVLGGNLATPTILLLMFWGLHLAFLGREVMQYFQNYLTQRNLTQRLLEPVAVEKESALQTNSQVDQDTDKMPSLVKKRQAVSIYMDSACVRAGGHTILEDISIDIRDGSHVAIVGASGAGKSSFVGLLLGWHSLSAGSLLVDGVALTSSTLNQLRKETVWVDPEVQIWNRSLIDNLCYGTNFDGKEQAVGEVIKKAELENIITKLPQGIYTPLGESGGLVSGGEGQRVRLGRGMLNSNARLVILDEPFRGLDQTQRRLLIARARELWRHATLLCVTHEVLDANSFDRVVVMEHGRIIEDGIPVALAKNPESLFYKMLATEQSLHQEIWGASFWQHWKLHNGRVISSEK